MAHRPFDGKTYDPALDSARLGSSLSRLRGFLLRSPNMWHSMGQLMRATGNDDWASVSARLRDLRKTKFGGFDIRAQRVTNGVWQYGLFLACADAAQAS